MGRGRVPSCSAGVDGDGSAMGRLQEEVRVCALTNKAFCCCFFALFASFFFLPLEPFRFPEFLVRVNE